MKQKSLSYPCYSPPRREECTHPELLAMYTEHLLQVRGVLGPKRHLRVVTCFLSLLDVSGCRVEDISTGAIQTFITEQGAYYQRRTVATIASSVRGFLRYLAFSRVVPRDLSEFVRGPRTFQGEREPRYLQDWQVRRIVESVDRTTVGGKRNYAILLLLAVYGLRAREIRCLHLEDIRWRAKNLLIRTRKCGDTIELPLIDAMAGALLAYVRVRPRTEHRQVFLRILPPHLPLKSSSLQSIVVRAMERSGVTVAHPGTHTFRYSRAQSLFAAQRPLPEIAATLGHRDLRTTLSYLSFTVHPLREVALNAGEDLA